MTGRKEQNEAMLVCAARRGEKSALSELLMRNWAWLKGLVYSVVGSIGLYYINRLIAHGPRAPVIEPAITGAPTLAPQAGALARIRPSSTPMSE